MYTVLGGGGGGWSKIILVGGGQYSNAGLGKLGTNLDLVQVGTSCICILFLVVVGVVDLNLYWLA